MLLAVNANILRPCKAEAVGDKVVPLQKGTAVSTEEGQSSDDCARPANTRGLIQPLSHPTQLSQRPDQAGRGHREGAGATDWVPRGSVWGRFL